MKIPMNQRLWRLLPYALVFCLGAVFGIIVLFVFEECSFREVNATPLEQGEHR
jgi:hypothetical protein